MAIQRLYSNIIYEPNQSLCGRKNLKIPLSS